MSLIPDLSKIVLEYAYEYPELSDSTYYITRDKRLRVIVKYCSILMNYIDEGKTIDKWLYFRKSDPREPQLIKIKEKLPKKIFYFFIEKYFPVLCFQEIHEKI